MNEAHAKLLLGRFKSPTPRPTIWKALASGRRSAGANALKGIELDFDTFQHGPEDASHGAAIDQMWAVAEGRLPLTREGA